MQGVHSIVAGRFFDSGGGSTAGDRKLMSHPLQNHQALKCPRCDSLNTKFCYYNNYNLSQPRHFCKNCRRYWTKGGVLRNVPVGGGCRKSKRSRDKKSSSETRTSSPPPPPATAIEIPAPTSSKKKFKSNSHSSSESSSLTAANIASASTEAMSAPTPNTGTNHLGIMQDSKFYMNNQSGMAQIESGLLEQGAESGIFSEIGNLSGLIPSTTDALPFGFGNISDMLPFRLGQSASQHDQWQQQQKWMVDNRMCDHHYLNLKLPEISGGSSMLDQTVQIDFSSSLQGKTTNHASFGSLDWQCVGDQCLFDLPNTVDQTYWSQSHWTEQDSTRLYLP